MPKYLSTIYKDFNEKVVDSTTNIIPNLQSTISLPPPLCPNTVQYSKLLHGLKASLLAGGAVRFPGLLPGQGLKLPGQVHSYFLVQSIIYVLKGQCFQPLTTLSMTFIIFFMNYVIATVIFANHQLFKKIQP